MNNYINLEGGFEDLGKLQYIVLGARLPWVHMLAIQPYVSLRGYKI